MKVVGAVLVNAVQVLDAMHSEKDDPLMFSEVDNSCSTDSLVFSRESNSKTGTHRAESTCDSTHTSTCED